MKKENLTPYRLFYNQNGHLSIVYNITPSKYYIFNYNGSVYSLSRSSNTTVNYTEAPDMSVEEFFINFTREKLEYENKIIFNAIVENYSRSKYKIETNRKLLLIL